MLEPALAVENLSYRYPGAQRDALVDLTLEIEPGELVLMAGLSGSGKTTLLRAACGLVPHFHGGEFSGRVSAAGMDTRDAGPGELARAVGFVAQDPETQVVSTTVRAELELPLELRGEPAPARARAVEEAALALAIPELLDRTTDALSGGELQRVALAATLVARPALVLLDEPTSQLDPVAGDELIGLLRRLNDQWGTAVVLCEHRVERCVGAVERVLAMDSGRLDVRRRAARVSGVGGAARARARDAGSDDVFAGRDRSAAGGRQRGASRLGIERGRSEHAPNFCNPRPPLGRRMRKFTRAPPRTPSLPSLFWSSATSGSSLTPARGR